MGHLSGLADPRVCQIPGAGHSLPYPTTEQERSRKGEWISKPLRERQEAAVTTMGSKRGREVETREMQPCC